MTRVDVTSREDVLRGKPFGTVGAYERIIGKAFFGVDPKNPHNRIVPNIDKAPKNAQGMVEFSADIYILAPKDQSKGNGVAFFEFPNRGRRDQMARFDRAPRGAPATPAAEFGDGLLMNNGYTLVWVGWQFSLARNGQLIGIDLPGAFENAGPVKTALTANRDAPTLALDADTALYPPVELNNPRSSLTARQNVYDAPRTIPHDAWQFAKVVNGQVVPDGTSLYMKDGFKAGQTYELSYEGKGAVMGGLGYAALRDVASAFKYVKGSLNMTMHSASRRPDALFANSFTTDSTPTSRIAGHSIFCGRISRAPRAAILCSRFPCPMARACSPVRCFPTPTCRKKTRRREKRMGC
jgi:hypothetical protein